MLKLENRNTCQLSDQKKENEIRATFYLNEEPNDIINGEVIPKLQAENKSKVEEASYLDKDKNHVDSEIETNKECEWRERQSIGTTVGSLKHEIDIKRAINRKSNEDEENNKNHDTCLSFGGESKISVDINHDISKLVKRKNDAETIISANDFDKRNTANNEMIEESGGSPFQNRNVVSEGDGKQVRNNSSGIGIKITMDRTDSSQEDEEVKTIMETCDELDVQSLIQKVKHTHRVRRKSRRYEEIRAERKRSKSFDNGSLQCFQSFNFMKYGISVGSGIPNDLLPGIEDYLSNVLANESLSEYAEERRQYFLERLDIIKLPPSIPPRPQSLGVRLYPVHSTPPSSNRDSIRSLEQDDFAAYQRELSRALQGEGGSSPDITEVKVYDDIGATDGSLAEVKTSDVGEEEESMYEIPQVKRTLSDSGYEKALELSPMSKSTSSEEQLSVQSGVPMPPPLPPRGERTASDAASRSSIGSILEDHLSDTPVNRSKLNRESSVPARLEKTADSRSERSSDDLLDGEYDGASCDSMDEVGSLALNQDSDQRIKLPRQVKRKHRSQNRKLGKSLSSLWEISQPFGMLEDIVMSGELHYKSKLTWTRKIVALTNGRLVCYKVDKTDSRPAFVILLTGYVATFHKREGRRSFEIHLNHENFETHIFLVDFKEWAEIWCEHINAAAKGQRAPGPVVHLARSSMIANPDGTYHMAHSNLQLSYSNASLTSSDGFEAEPGTVKVKKRDQSGTKTAKMGSFAFRATLFFESLGKKSSVKKPSSTSSERTPSVERIRQSSGSQSSLGDMSEKLSPMTPDSHIEESPLESPVEMKKHIKHQGYVHIYSSFNKRKWGKRWCLVHENNFECYRTQTSEVCELEFLLRNCILRRAIEETKSELGLMLLENNRERITIEPVNWTELGSWLRVLMQETSTPATPKGLEGYMDDTHPYHEAVEITRVPDPCQKLMMLSTKSDRNSMINPVEIKSQYSSNDKRDSGICSSESTDGRFNSLERNLNSPKVHPCYNSSSLPRVSVSDTGDIYTQVKKPTGTGSKLSPETGNRNTCNQSKSILDYKYNSDKNKNGKQNHKEDDELFFDFDLSPFTEPAFKRGSSLVDEIMSELNNQSNELNNNVQTADETVDNMSENSSSHTNFSEMSKRKSSEFNPNTSELSPIKSVDVTVTGNDSDFFCSSFIEKHEREDNVVNVACDLKAAGEESETESKANKVKEPSVLRRYPSNMSGKDEAAVDDVLAELRTRLVQLKKDRISIRDRKQLISSETDRVFLDAEYERLNRECQKVTDEINSIEQSTITLSDDDSNKSNDLRANIIEEEVNNTELNTLNSHTAKEGIDNSSSGENRTEERNIQVCSSDKNEIVTGTCDKPNGSTNEVKESVHLDNSQEDNLDKNVNGSAGSTIENQEIENSVIKGDLKEMKCDSETDSQYNKLFHDSQELERCKTSDCTEGSVIDNQCNNELNIVCDTENVPKTGNIPENTHSLSEKVKNENGDKQDAGIAESTSTDHVIDKLSKEFERNLFLKEK